MVQVLAKCAAGAQPEPPRPPSPLRERLSFFVQHFTQPAVANMAPELVEQLLAHELPQAERTLRLEVFDQLSLRLRGPREAVPHHAQVLAFVCATARERLAESTRALAAAPTVRARNALLLPLYVLRRAPMPRSIIDGADALLALYAAPCAPAPRAAAPTTRQLAQNAVGGPRTPRCETVALRTLQNYLPLQPVRKSKGTRTHLRAANEADSQVRISSFEVDGHPSYTGFLSSTFQLGGFCKLRVLLTAQNEFFAVRQAPTQPQGRVRARRAFADGTVEDNHRLELLDPTRYVHELEAQRLAHSSLRPQLTLFDQKQRLWDVVPLFNGDLFGLSERFAKGALPGGVLVRTAQAVLRVSAKLDDNGWQHNDVKPDNVFWKRSGEVELGDFGLAGPIEAPGHPGTCGYLDPTAVLEPARRGGRADLYALAMTLVHLVDPYHFDAFPLAFHADGLSPSAVDYAVRLRRTARRAERTHAAWRPLHAAAHADGGTWPLVLAPDVSAVECAWAQLRAAAGSTLANAALLRWAHPDPAARGRPREQLEALEAAYPEGDDLLAQSAAQLAEAGASDAGARRIDATIAALTAFRDAWTHARAPGPPRHAAVAATP